MRTNTSLLAASLAAALLTGCGGGGGTSPSAAIPNPTQSSPATQSSSVSAQDVAQSATDAAFTPIDTGEADAAISSGSLTSSSARSPMSTGFACKNRRTRTITTNPDGSVTIETVDYYDQACTQKERDDVAVRTQSSGAMTIARTITTYGMTGAQLGMRKQNYNLTGSNTNGSWTIASSFYPGTSTTPMDQLDHAVTVNSSSYVASTGRIVNDAAPSIDASYGRQGATNATIGTDASGDTTYTGTHNGSTFKGALGALTISSSPPFTIGGGTQIGSSALSGAVAYDQTGNLVSVNLTGTLLNGNTLAVTSSTAANGALQVNGTVTSAAGSQVATFTTDAHGNGVLTLANGTQVPIVDWHPVW